MGYTSKIHSNRLVTSNDDLHKESVYLFEKRKYMVNSIFYDNEPGIETLGEILIRLIKADMDKVWCINVKLNSWLTNKVKCEKSY